MIAVACALLLAAPGAGLAVARAAPLEGAGRLPVIEASAGVQWGRRILTYRDALTPALLDDRGAAQLQWVASAALYPLANRGLPIASALGLVGSLARPAAPGRYDPMGASLGLESRLTRWDAGLRLRLGWGGLDLGGLSLRWVSLSREISGQLPAGGFAPVGTLQAWAPGADLRLPLGPLALAVSAALVLPVEQDALGRAFPRGTSTGFDGGASLTLDLFRGVALRAEARWTRVVRALRPLPYDPYVAGGATDDSRSAGVTLALRG